MSQLVLCACVELFPENLDNAVLAKNTFKTFFKFLTFKEMEILTPDMIIA